MKFLYLVILLSLSNLFASAQISLPFRQFNSNPFLFNPAFVGDVENPKMTLLHRQQWLQVTDAPVTFGLNAQFPTQRRISFGLTILSTETVGLQNNTFLPTVGYKIVLNDYQSLRFGLSLGLGLYSLDLEGADFSNDPTVMNAAANSTYASANFGILYKRKHWRLGVSFPEMINSQPIMRKSDYQPLLNQLYSLGYQLKVGPSGKVIIEPHVLFRLGSDFQNFWEVGSTVTWNDLLKAGTSFRQDNGFGFLVGVKPSRFLGFNYVLEPRPVSASFVQTSTHEFSIEIWFHRKVSEAELPR